MQAWSTSNVEHHNVTVFGLVFHMLQEYEPIYRARLTAQTSDASALNGQ